MNYEVAKHHMLASRTCEEVEMIRSKYLTLVLVIMVLVLFNLVTKVASVEANTTGNIALVVTGTLTAQPNGNGVVTSIEEGEIKNVIRSYFDVRYLALSSLQLDDFSNLVSYSYSVITTMNKWQAKGNSSRKAAILRTFEV